MTVSVAFHFISLFFHVIVPYWCHDKLSYSVLINLFCKFLGLHRCTSCGGLCGHAWCNKGTGWWSWPYQSCMSIRSCYWPFGSSGLCSDVSVKSQISKNLIMNAWNMQMSLIVNNGCSLSSLIARIKNTWPAS